MKRATTTEIRAAYNRGAQSHDFAEYYRLRYQGLSWSEVLELEEYFDGETEIEAAARKRWKEANAK